MKRAVLLCLAVFFLFSSVPAFAELFEIKGKGFVNGEVTAEDEKTITLKDTAGHSRVVQKSLILMREEEKKTSSFDIVKQAVASTARKVADPVKNFKLKLPAIDTTAAAKPPGVPAYRPATGHQADIDAATQEADHATNLMRDTFSAQLKQQRLMRKMTQEEELAKEEAKPKTRFVSLDDDKKT